MDQLPILVCFAVKEEAKFFLPSKNMGPCERLITGMGLKNTLKNFRAAIATVQPRLVITAGFAGGLNPKLRIGTVVFDEDPEAGLAPKLLALDAVPVRFHCATRVAVTAVEKRELWKSSGADAVEMESAAIRMGCRGLKIPSATIRVISDAAEDDLPLDFNALMTPYDRINYARLAWKLLGSPQKIPRLMKFRRQTIFAARKLADALHGALRDVRC
jgi:adenosylhomocysteine nucleosidase